MKHPKNFIPFSKPTIDDEEIQEAAAALKGGWLTTGPRTKQFEKSFASYKGMTDALALNSCTSALQLALFTANIREGDEVITTPMTFCATVNSIIHAGATPVLADIDLLSMNIDPDELLKKITPRTKAVILVHFAGRICDMSSLKQICDKYHLIMIEDCAHAIESEYQGERAGTVGDFGCFSFYATKNLTTGEGGMLLAKNTDTLDRARKLSLHGMNTNAWKRYQNTSYVYYDVEEAGYKYNMTDIQAALGIHQLKKLEQFRNIRERIWGIYNEELQNLPVELPEPIPKGERHAYHLYTILVDEKKSGVSRDAFLKKMNELGVGLSVHYLSIPEHSYYQKRYLWNPNDFPRAQRVGKTTVSLPLHPRLNDENIRWIIKSVKKSLHLQ